MTKLDISDVWAMRQLRKEVAALDSEIRQLQARTSRLKADMAVVKGKTYLRVLAAQRGVSKRTIHAAMRGETHGMKHT